MAHTIHSPRRRISPFVIAMVAAFVAVPSLNAETTDPVDRARALESAAAALETHRPEWSRAARLYREAADLRADDDVAKVRTLKRAAHIRYQIGEKRAAMRDAADAAQVARRQGDVLEAAHAYLDAAWIATEIGRTREAHRFVAEAAVLTTSPLLADADRRGIQGRLPGTS